MTSAAQWGVSAEKTTAIPPAVLGERVARLCSAEWAPREFFSQLLEILLEGTGALAGAAWVVGRNGKLESVAQLNIEKVGLLDSPEDQQHHDAILHDVFTSGIGKEVAISFDLPHEQLPHLASEMTILVEVTRFEGQINGLIEIFFEPRSLGTSHEPQWQFLRQFCELTRCYYQARAWKQGLTQHGIATHGDAFARIAHRSLKLNDVAYSVVNEARRLLEIDQVSLATICKGQRRIAAISDHVSVDRRANAVRALDHLAATVILAGEPVWYFGDDTDLSEQITAAIHDYLEEVNRQAIAILPLRKPLVPDELGQSTTGEIVGALILEQAALSRSEVWLKDRVEPITRHTAAAVANAVEHESLFLMPVWRTIGKSRWLVATQRLPKTLLAVGLIAAAIAALFFVPTDLEIESKGTLEPVQRREVFAPLDGVVDAILVEHGQEVQVGSPLFTLRSTELSIAIAEVQGRLQSTLKQMKAIELAESNIRLKPEELSQLSGQSAQLHATKTSLEQQVELLRKKQEQLSVASPLDGQIVTWQLRDKLIYRPVQRGQSLVTIADTTGDWQLELHVPEDRLGYVATAQRELGDQLSVRFILASNPNVSHSGRISEIHTSAEIRGEEGNTVLVKVQLDQDSIAPGERRPGAMVTAKITCERTSLGYAWFHDVINFAHRMWFKIF